MNFLSKKFNKPLSTLKLNAKILKELRLIDYGNLKHPKKVKLTDLGKFVLEILNYNDKEYSTSRSELDGGVSVKTGDNNHKFIENVEQKNVLSISQQWLEEVNIDKGLEIKVLGNSVHQISILFRQPDKKNGTEIILQQLKKRSRELRGKIMKLLKEFNNFHLSSSLSIIDLLLAIFTKWFLIDQLKPDDNVLILSKGHSALTFYMLLAEFGLIEEDELKNFGKLGSRLTSHVQKGLPLVKVSSGSLGQGLSIANGIALASKIYGEKWKTFVILGDGELDEGQIWEAAMTASHYHLDNIIAIVDRNKNQLNGYTEKIKSKEPLKEKWKSFGWTVFEIDGHNHYQILDALTKAERIEGKPKVIIANTSGDLRNGHN